MLFPFYWIALVLALVVAMIVIWRIRPALLPASMLRFIVVNPFTECSDMNQIPANRKLAVRAVPDGALAANPGFTWTSLDPSRFSVTPLESSPAAAFVIPLVGAPLGAAQVKVEALSSNGSPLFAVLDVELIEAIPNPATVLVIEPGELSPL